MGPVADLPNIRIQSSIGENQGGIYTEPIVTNLLKIARTATTSRVVVKRTNWQGIDCCIIATPADK